jgi:outer membrane lipoprotein SlyB
MMRRASVFSILAVAAALTTPAAAQGAPDCANCGVVQSINIVSARQQWTPLGAVADPPNVGGGPTGQTGGATMMSFGQGFSNKGLVVVGAAGGAAYAQKPNEHQRQRWDVTVKMDSGPPPRLVSLSYEPYFQEGDRVRVFGNQLELINP